MQKTNIKVNVERVERHQDLLIKVGSYLLVHGFEGSKVYQLARVEQDKFTLINVISGNRIFDPVRFDADDSKLMEKIEDRNAVPRYVVTSIAGHEFEVLENVTINAGPVAVN